MMNIECTLKSECQGFTYSWTDHAISRWSQRFNGINKNTEFESARRIGRKTRKKIKKLTPVNADKYMRNFNGRYYLIGRSNIVFVIDSTINSIVTVFHLYSSDD